MLHHAMGVCPGDEILVPSHTAFPSIEPMIHRGARPVFVDIDETYCIDVDQLEAAMSARTVGILPVHLYGHPANMDGILSGREETRVVGRGRLRPGIRRAVSRSNCRIDRRIRARFHFFRQKISP